MVRPHLDFAVQASFPYLQKDVQLIERIQRLATRCVKSFRSLPYPERLHEFQISSWSATFSVLLSSRCTSCSTVTWTCLWMSSLNRQLQVTSAGTTSSSVNHVIILPSGTRISLYVRPGRGVDCFNTSLKLRQCPVSRTAWMPTDSPSSLSLFHPSPLIVLMLMALARRCYCSDQFTWFGLIWFNLIIY